MAIAALDVGYTLLYALFSLCIIFPPSEFVAAGFTVSSIFSGILGSEEFQFTHYHIRRTTLTLVIHSFIPMGYVFGLREMNEMYESGGVAATVWKMMMSAAVFVPLGVLALAYYWTAKGTWDNHPIAKSLALYSEGSHWKQTASDLNVQFRRVDKFATAANSYTRIIATESWFIKVQQYTVKIAHQDDIQLMMVSSEEHTLTNLNSTSVQFLNLLVTCVRPQIGTFSIRLSSLEYGELREKLRRPVVNANNVAVHKTLSDRFLDAFKDQVMLNSRYHMPTGSEDLEACIGCTQATANIKLQKLCSSQECVQCNCRPMWCLSCMGKWWASRQDQDQPSTWMGGRTPCPLCRSVFCMLDVCLVQTVT